jgi:hypothetical protein
MKLPEVFEVNSYAKFNNDLVNLSNDELMNHYLRFGQNEGRICSSIHSRHSFLETLQELDLSSILEIGPFNRPMISGPNVKYFEVLNKNQLELRASEQGLDPSTIPEIDYVDEFGDLTSVDKIFSAAVSSHCVEHQPDLISHLIQVSDLLEANGYYFLVIPDKKFCFDHYIPETSVCEIISNHLEKRTNHTLTNVLKHKLETTHNDPVRHWNGDHGTQGYKLTLETVLSQATKFYDESKTTYMDVHSMFFTPESFSDVLKELLELKLIDFKVERIYQTVRNDLEFFAVLRKL